MDVSDTLSYEGDDVYRPSVLGVRVLLVTGEYPPVVGGVGRYAEGLCAALAAAGCGADVVTSVPSDRESGSRVRRGPRGLNRTGVKLVPLTLLSAASRAMRRYDAQIAMTCGHEALVCRALAVVSRTPTVLVAHGSELLAESSRAMRRRVGLSNLRWASAVLANSAFTKGLLTDAGIAESRITILHPPNVLTPVRRADVEARFGLEGKRVLLTTARLVPRKGHRHALTALASLRRDFSDVVYVVTGLGPLAESLVRQATDLGVSDIVRFTGEVDDETVRALYGCARVYLAPNEEDGADVEGFGISIVEAMACGIPVIAGVVGGVRDAAGSGEGVKLVQAGNAAAIEQATRECLRHPLRRGALPNDPAATLADCGSRLAALIERLRKGGK